MAMNSEVAEYLIAIRRMQLESLAIQYFNDTKHITSPDMCWGGLSENHRAVYRQKARRISEGKTSD